MEQGHAGRSLLGRGWCNPAWIVGLLCLVTSAWVWHWVDEQARVAEDRRLEVEADRVIDNIDHRLRTSLNLLRGLQRYAATVEHVDCGVWANYLSAFDRRDYPGLVGATHVQNANPDSLPALLAEVGVEHPGIAIRPAGPREAYRVVTHVYPQAIGSRIGLDIGTIAVSRPAQDRARDTGEPAMTPQLAPLGYGVVEPDVVVYVPLYAGYTTPATVAQRRAEHRGYVCAAFQIEELLVGVGSPSLTFSLYDGTEFQTGAESPEAGLPLLHRDGEESHGQGEWSHLGVVSCGGRTWLLRFHAKPGMTYDGAPARIAVVVSVAVSVLLTGLVWVMGSTRRRAMTLAQEMTATLRESESRFRSAFDDAGVGMALVSPEGRWLRVNEALCGIVGYSRDEMLARTFQEMTHPDDLIENLRLRDRMLRGEQSTYSLEKRYITRGGRPVWVSVSASLVRDEWEQPLYCVAMVQDIAERKRMEDQLRHLAAHDRLTGLPGRAVLRERLDQCLARARRWHDYRFAVLFLDLDDFKRINDTCGHRAGDEILIEVALRLQTQLRHTDVVARHGSEHIATRYGGDEFVVLLDRVAEAGDAQVLAERLRNALSEPYRVNGVIVRCPPSIGIARSDANYVSAEEMLHAADLAMYTDKAARRKSPPVAAGI